MTTVNDVTNGVSFMDFSISLEKIKTAEYKKGNFTVTFKVPKFIAIPIIVTKNLFTLIKTFLLSKNVRAFVLKFQVVFLRSSEDEKIELYSSFATLKENLEYAIEGKDLRNPKGGLLTKEVADQLLDLYEFLVKEDETFYKIAYPNNKNKNDPEYIKMVLDAHSFSNLQHY